MKSRASFTNYAEAFTQLSSEPPVELGTLAELDRQAGLGERYYSILPVRGMLLKFLANAPQYLPELAVSGPFAQRLARLVGSIINAGKINSADPPQVARVEEEFKAAWEETCPQLMQWVSVAWVLSGADAEALQTIANARAMAMEDVEKIKRILDEARVAAGAVGVSKFAKFFADRANSLETDARKWLTWTVILVFLTAGGALAFYFAVDVTEEKMIVLQHFGTKVLLIVLLLTATMWCAKMYRALKHQAAAYRHRELSIQTFQDFTNATSDLATKNAVLLEATRAAFSQQPSGFIEGAAPEPEIKIVEMIKSVTGVGGGGSGGTPRL